VLKKSFLALAAACTIGAVGSASAAVITLDFEGLKNNEAVTGFYNGTGGSLGSLGTNYGVQFGANTLALIDSDAGGTGNFANEPTPSTIMFFTTGTAVVLNYAPGFSSGFSFWYTSLAVGGTVTVYDDVNASGNVLGTISLAALGGACQGDPFGSFCNWSIGSLAFNGLAKSIDFGGTVSQIGFDNITFGSTDPNTNPTPEPGSLALVGAALLGLVAARRRS
jgi:hypothetical protein